MPERTNHERRLRVRRTLATAVALAVAATLLTGCGGIPTSGAPVTGREIDTDVELPIGLAPRGPEKGETQEEIVVNFLNAAAAPQNNFELSRLFLSSQFAEKWDSDAFTSIRSGGGIPSTQSPTQVDYSFRTSAFVDVNGRYEETRESETSTLSFSFVKEKGEWRISKAPAGVVIAEDQFPVVYRPLPVYFFDPSFEYLVPDMRWFPARADVAFRVVSALLAGPSSWYSNGVLVNEFPQGASIGEGRVSVDTGVATVDLSEEVGLADDQKRERMRQQLSSSLSALGSVTTIAITVAGAPLAIKATGVAAAATALQVNPAPLVRSKDRFGFFANDRIATIDRISSKVLSTDPREVTLMRGGSAAAVLGKGGVWAVRANTAKPVLVDARPGLAAPSIDTQGFIWSVPEADARSLRVFDLDGNQQDFVTNLPSDSRVASLTLSRDGARLVMYVSTPGGARLMLAGIVRQANAPISLGEIRDLPVGPLAPIDAAWVNDRTVATLSGTVVNPSVDLFTIGGPSDSLGQVAGGASIVGGNGGADGVRVLTEADELFRPRGTTWTRVPGLSASFIATQQ
ncbi:MAG: LpqB family beta-propeller domain-containing protein [Microbacteriaceae bacterium]